MLLSLVPPSPFRLALHLLGDPRVLCGRLGDLLPPEDSTRHLVGRLLSEHRPSHNINIPFHSLSLAQYLPLAPPLPRAAPLGHVTSLNF